MNDMYSLESFLEYCDDIAEEGLISPDQKQKWALKGGADSKEAKNLRQQARAAAKSGNYGKAIALTNQALQKYQAIKSQADKIPQKMLPAGQKYQNGSRTYTGMAKTSLLKWVNKRISECQAEVISYKNKGRGA